MVFRFVRRRGLEVVLIYDSAALASPMDVFTHV